MSSSITTTDDPPSSSKALKTTSSSLTKHDHDDDCCLSLNDNFTNFFILLSGKQNPVGDNDIYEGYTKFSVGAFDFITVFVPRVIEYCFWRVAAFVYSDTRVCESGGTGDYPTVGSILCCLPCRCVVGIVKAVLYICMPLVGGPTLLAICVFWGLRVVVSGLFCVAAAPFICGYSCFCGTCRRSSSDADDEKGRSTTVEVTTKTDERDYDRSFLEIGEPLRPERKIEPPRPKEMDRYHHHHHQNPMTTGGEDDYDDDNKSTVVIVPAQNPFGAPQNPFGTEERAESL